MNTDDSNIILNQIFDKFIVNDIQKKVNMGQICSDEIVDCLTKYVRKHYYIYDNHVTPKISNFYVFHKN